MSLLKSRSVLPTHVYKNPVVIIIGISSYQKHSNGKIPDLPAVQVDVKNMYDLFKNKLSYKYVYQQLNVFKYDNKTVEMKRKKAFDDFLGYKGGQIEEINEKDPVDGIIFVYSGHGDEGVILGSGGKKIQIQFIHGKFDNEMVASLENSPRLYIFDCCRGPDMELPEPKKELAEPKKELTGKGTNEVRVGPVNVSKDTIYWYGSSEGMKSFTRLDNNGSFFITAIYDIMLEMLKKGESWNLASELRVLVFNHVSKAKSEQQTPEMKLLIGYEVYFKPNLPLPREPSVGSPETDRTTLSPENMENEIEDQKISDLDDLDDIDDIDYITYNSNDKEMNNFKEGLVMGGAIMDLLISTKRNLGLDRGQISDISEMNISMMHGIINMLPEPKKEEEEKEKENGPQKCIARHGNGIFDIQYIANEYDKWDKVTKFELGDTITECIKKKHVQNMKYVSEILNEKSEYGGTKSNGSMMRITSLILLLLPLNDDFKSIFLILKEDSELTHYNYTCHIINCCLFLICQYLIIKHNDENKHIKSIEYAEDFLKFLTQIFEKFEKLKKYEKNLNEVKEWLLNGKKTSKDKLITLKESGAFIRGAFEHMIYYLYNKYTFVKAYKEIFKLRCTDNAVYYIVGSVLGAYYGFNALNEENSLLQRINLINKCQTKEKKYDYYQPKQFYNIKFLDILKKKGFGTTTGKLTRINIYKPSKEEPDDLDGPTIVTYTPNSSDTKFVKCLFYENYDDKENQIKNKKIGGKNRKENPFRLNEKQQI